MRLFTKIFLFGMLVFGLAFSASGYFLLHYSLESSMAREVDFALKQFQYDKFTVQSALLTWSEVSIAVSIGDGSLPGEPGDVTVWQIVTEGMGVPKASAPGEEAQPGTEAAPGGEAQSGAETAPGGEAQSGAETAPGGEAPAEFRWGLTEQFFESLAGEIDVPAAFFAEDKTPLYSEIAGLDTAFLDSLSEGAHRYQFWDGGDEAGACAGSVLMGTVLHWEVPEQVESVWKTEPKPARSPAGEAQDSAEPSQGPGGEVRDSAEPAQSLTETAGRRIYFVTQWDISKTISQQETLRQYFVRCYLAAVAFGIVLLAVLSALLTGPLKRMAKAARRMAEGCYEERLAISGRDEIGELAESFNQMAGAVEEKVGELSRAAREKEDFVANFAHELKTPLTSIIGYADTLYQKELPRETVRKASWHIWNEGMRLESLSLKLMELTVLGRQEFPLEEMSAAELLGDVAESLEPVFQEKEILFTLEAEPAFVRGDCDLLKTLLLNLLDNSMKAGAGHLALSGRGRGDRYEISVRDDGCGMEEAELSRVTEAFYMVDKARSRRQHGAGLGLALADRIAGIHGSGLTFRSRKGRGTEVTFDLECGKGGAEDEES